LLSRNPLPYLSGPFAPDTLARPCLPAGTTAAFPIALAVPAFHRNPAQRLSDFRFAGRTAIPGPMNPNPRLELVAIRGTRGRSVSQGFEDRGLCLADK